MAKPDEIDLFGQLILGKSQLWLLGKEIIFLVYFFSSSGLKSPFWRGGQNPYLTPKTGPFTPQNNFLKVLIFFLSRSANS